MTNICHTSFSPTDYLIFVLFFFFQAEDGIRDVAVTGVQTCALPIFMFDINCKGLLWCSQAAARQMIEQGRGGKIINLASQAGRRGEALVLAYCASKACVISMTQSMALALAPHKINVNGIAPGIVDTPFWVEVDKQFAKLFGWEIGEPKRKFVESIPLGRIEQPEDVTGTAIFLASTESDYMTQQTLNVDGGNWPG